MRRFLPLLVLCPFLAAQAQPTPVASDEILALHRAADRCDTDVFGIPDIDGCGATYAALIAEYEGYPAYFVARLDRLHAVAVKCDSDVSGVPDIDTCGPVYSRLVNWYGDYPDYRAAVVARAPSN